MIVRAVRLFTVITMKALFKLEVVRMKLLFFPTMTVWASIFKLATIFIGGNEMFGIPVLAHIL